MDQTTTPFSPLASILLVDDEPSSILLLRRILRDYSDVRFATNGADALRLAYERAPDLILLDENMPGESGSAVCRKFKQDPSLREVAIIFVTAHHDIRSETQAFEAGAADFLPKPVSPPAMLARVRLHLQLKSHADGLRTARNEAQAATRTKAAFLATMSHEIRTPLNAVIGLTGFLLRSGLTQEQIEWAQTIRSSSDHLLTVINDVLDFSKLEADKIALESRPFSLRECLKSALDIIRAQARQKDIELSASVDEGVPAGVRSDPARLRQVLLNLLSNAIKFTPAGGRVSIAVTAAALREGYSIEFAVSDTGIGLTSEQKERLFQPYAQADATIAREYGGTGLGLAISLRLAELMGGRIWLDSEPGCGATFRFMMVAPAATPPPVAEETPALTELARDHPLRILVAEDQPVNQQVFRLFLAQLGYQADCVADGVAALAAVERQPYDVVFMDVRMPQMDGLEATRRLRARWPWTQRPRIIGLSANALPADRCAGEQAGMSDYLSKPVEAAALHQALRQCRRIEREQTPIDEQSFGRLALLAAQGAGPPGPAVLAELVRGFLSQAALHVDSVAAALESGDAEALELAAHSLKSSAAMFGAQHLSRLSAGLEQEAQQAGVSAAWDRSAMTWAVAALRQALHEADEALLRRIAS